MTIDVIRLQLAQRVASTQAGVITTVQGDRLGVSKDVRARLVHQAIWRRIVPGYYAVTPDSWMQRAWAGVLIGGPKALLGGEAALHAMGLWKEPQEIVVYVGRTAGFPQDERWRFIRAERHRAKYGLIPHTTLDEAVIDVAQEWSVDALVALVGNVVTSGRTTVTALQDELESRARHRQRRLVTDILADVEDGTTSALEYRYRYGVEKPHRLPRPARQVAPFQKYRVDNWYEAQKLIVEVDGLAYHSGVAASTDMDRDNYHSAQGVQTLRFTWNHIVTNPCQTAHTVATALTARGWQGQIRRCPRCASSQQHNRRTLSPL
ncbi:MAG: endonuclease domain-containing protein [Propionibacteriaceae bacterium]|nr:endonuclease domain-containing protein [Propionibacteriaceae bacterium]